MNNFPSNVKEKFNSILSNMSENHWFFSENPGHAFTRQQFGKLNFEDTMRMIVGMGKGNTNDEIMDYFQMDPDRIPSQSAFNQRRKQISLFAFEYLFHKFSQSFPRTTHSFNDYCVLAFDGTHVVYDTNANILEDFNKPRLTEYKGYNHMHLNGFVDVNSKSFLDILIQPGQKPDERKAFHTMLDQFSPENPENYIITVDRGYESYDFIFHCELKNFKYVARAKAPSSSRSILSSYIDDLPDDQEEFDVVIERFFTDRFTNIMRDQSHVYHYMNPSKPIPHFQDLLNGMHLCYIRFRAVKIKTGANSYEYIITNLPGTICLNDIKECYHLRWGIEVCFRYLKHAAGLLHFHSKKPEFLKQEIYATLTLYNFGIFLANEAANENKKRKRESNNKYFYEVDVSTAIKTARKYLLLDDKHKPIDIIRLMLKYVHAVKTDFRQFPRSLRGIGMIHFSYR